MTEQEKCLQEYEEAQRNRAASGAEDTVQLGMGLVHAQDTIPRQTGQGGGGK
ncbi:hypothetical protein AB0C93_37870 [Streptomyces sp. NPDC048518]|uniref:hypothetical protein n=1 Tax=Streptomyces sp. NPDC048518 TaxID=3155029 RepID=UPI0033C18752